jgi:predicted aldo/keto reductase-like oxidoreductase
METRREFIKKAGIVSAIGLMSEWAMAFPGSDRLGEVLPMRQLIRNGEKVTAFCLGGYHLGVPEDPKESERMIERSMELGVRFYDNARGYHKGVSEERMGKFLTPKYRDDIFLMTKSPAKTAEGVRKQLEDSLKAQNTDYLDLWQIHAIRDPEDADARINAGVLDEFLKAKEEGKTRYIGFTGHRNPVTHLYFLEFLEKRGIELDTCQMPLNVCDPSFESFEKNVMPELLKREYGIIAMKTMAGGSMMGDRIDTTPDEIKTSDIPDLVSGTDITLANLHQYVYALPVSSLCSGCVSVRQIEENVAVLQKLKSLSKRDKKKLIAMAKPFAGTIVENYKRVMN